MQQLHQHWGGLLARGIAAIIFGIIAFVVPGFTLSILAYLIGIFFMLDGIIALLLGASARSQEFLLEGVVGLAVGFLLFFFPQQSVSVFFLLVAFWALVTGLIEIMAAVKLREYIRGEFWLFLAGIVSVLFGVVVFFNPLMTAVLMTMFLGVYALFFGVLVSLLALRVRSHHAPTKTKKKK